MSALVEHTPLPSRHAVRSLIEETIERDVDVRDGQPVAPRTTNVIGVYVTPRLATTAIILADLEAAARLGGALGRIPRGAVEDAIRQRSLTPSLRDGVSVLLEKLATVLTAPNTPQIELYQVYGPDDVVPADVARLCGIIGHRMDIGLQIAGYGTGQLSVVVC